MKPIGLGDFNDLAVRLRRLGDSIEIEGRQWVRDRAAEMRHNAIANLDHQGRGGTPPPLSAATREIYRRIGEPDGSGIHDHIEISYHDQGDRYIAIAGITEGKPSMIAHVQEHGTTIAVTPKMRGWLAAHGIFLRQSTTHITVPGRHFWSQAFRDVNRDRPNLFN